MKNMEIQIKIENFEGPLDLLIHLIEKKQMKISEINISQIIDTFSVHSFFKSPVNSAFASFADRFSKHWFARLVSLNK